MIIPHPRTLERHPGRFRLPAELHLTAGPGAEAAADLLAHHLGPDRPRTGNGPWIHLDLVPGGEPESYRLHIEPTQVTLTAPRPAGLRHGVQTLRQLLAPDGSSWPCVTVVDAPALPRRGLMLDVARHLAPMSLLYALVDELALHKLNVLQLHLTDDQGWRLEIPSRPRLTEVGGWRTRPDGSRYGGWYSRRELAGLVRHAERSGVEIVPEIEMPGHVRAALAAYPELGNEPERRLTVWNRRGISRDILGVHDAALDFGREVLSSVAELFPSRYVHLGGDECPTIRWEQSPPARDRAARLGFDDVRLLHAWFLGRMHEHLASLGRRAVAWDESERLPGRLPTGTVVTAWLDAAHGGRAVARGHQVLMAPHRATYLDYRQSTDPDEPSGHPDELLTLADVYAFDPLAGGLPVADPAGPHRPGVIGAQAQLWTEDAPTEDHVRRLLYPRLCAFAESTWSGARRPGFADFRQRLDPHLGLLARLGALSGPGPRWTGPDAVPVLEPEQALSPETMGR